MASVHDDEPGFWPGYVAAVSGLVQGLLIMAMALAAAIFALGQISRKAPALAGGRPPLPAAPAPAGAPRADLLPLAVPVPPAAGQAGPAPLQPQVAGSVPRIVAGFQGDAVILPDSARPGLIVAIYRAQGAGVQRWRITMPASLDDPRDQRAAYLRLLGLRNLLVQQGVAAGAIDLWIEQGGAVGATREARIEPIDASGAPVALPAGDRP